MLWSVRTGPDPPGVGMRRKGVADLLMSNPRPAIRRLSSPVVTKA